jgi:hypothetical protein
LWSLAILSLFLGWKAHSMPNRVRETSELSRYLPGDVNGWRAVGQDEVFDPETIFDYIDGAGEVYRAYNFRHLLARRYLKEGEPDLVADIFDMGSSDDAFGVFTHDLEGESLRIGQGAVYKGGLLSFWKDRYFVSLYAEAETPETKQTIFALGEAVASAIPGAGKKPTLLSCVPAGFDLETARYFHGHIILNYHFFISSENILLLDQKTNAVLVSAGEKPDIVFLLIVRYPGEGATRAAEGSFARAYMPDAVEPGLVQTEDKKWTRIEKKGHYLIIVFGAPSGSRAEKIVSEVASKIPG